MSDEKPKGRLLIVDRGQKNGKDFVIFERDGGYFGIIIDNEVHMHTSQEEVYRWLEENTQSQDAGVYFHFGGAKSGQLKFDMTFKGDYFVGDPVTWNHLGPK